MHARKMTVLTCVLGTGYHRTCDPIKLRDKYFN